MPATSSSDSRAICASIRNFEAFPRVRDPSVRLNLEARLLRCERILTFKSFHADMILLRACYQPLRKLFPVARTTLQGACEASFRHNPKYFRTNYIDLWLYVMRNFPFLSDDPSAGVKKEPDGVQIVKCTESEPEISKLASFAASRGFWSYDICNKPLKEADGTNPVVVCFPELSRDEPSLRSSNRCSRPRGSDFEQGWKHLSLENIFQDQARTSKKHPTPFAVVRSMAQSFWGSEAPEGIGDCERFLQSHQCIEQCIDPSGFEAGMRFRSDQDDITDNAYSFDAVSRISALLPRPASSVYDEFIQLPSTRGSPHCQSADNNEAFSPGAIIDMYANEPIADDEPNSTGSRASNNLLQVEESEMPHKQIEEDRFLHAQLRRKPDRARSERADDNLRRIKNRAGHQGIQHRVEKRPRGHQKANAKPNKENATMARQNHDRKSREAITQTELDVQSGNHRGEAEDACVESVNKLAASYRQLISPADLSNEERPVTLYSESATAQLGRDETNAAHMTLAHYLPNEEQKVGEGLDLTTHDQRLHDWVQQPNDEQSLQLDVDLQYAHNEYNAECEINGASGNQSQIEESSLQQEQNKGVKVSQTTFGQKQNRARPELTDNVLHQIKGRTGYRGATHRVEKRQPATHKMKAKQQEEIAARALQNRKNLSAEGALQSSFAIRSEDERLEVEEIRLDRVHQFLASQSDESIEQSNVSPLCEQVISQKRLSDKELPERNDMGLVVYTDDPPIDIGEIKDPNSTRQKQGVGEVLDPVLHEKLGQRLHDQSQRPNDEQPSYLTVDQRYGYNERDIERGMREADEQRRSAADVVDEVYDDSLVSEQQEGQGYCNDKAGNTLDQGNTIPPLFPGGRTDSEAQPSESAQSPPKDTETQALDESQSESKDLSTSTRDKRRAIRNATELGRETDPVVPEIEVSCADMDEATIASKVPDTDKQYDRPRSMFPGVSLNPKDANHGMRARASVESSRLEGPFHKDKEIARAPLLNLPDQLVGRRRKFEDEPESTNIHIRSPRSGNSSHAAQLTNWESTGDQVASIELISDELEEDRIYVTSTFNIEDLASRQNSKHKRLWSWSKEEREHFVSQVDDLLRKGFALQVITSDQHASRHYCTVSPTAYWDMHFAVDPSLYWMAILTTQAVDNQSWTKVRRTEAQSHVR